MPSATATATISGAICSLDECPDYPAEGFVKRIVGVPGDRVEHRRGVFYLNVAPVAGAGTSSPFR